MQPLGVRADHGERLHLAAIEREQPTLVLEQDDRPASRLERERLVLRCIGDAFGSLGIDEGILE
jgi:hypothetical protein